MENVSIHDSDKEPKAHIYITIAAWSVVMCVIARLIIKVITGW